MQPIRTRLIAAALAAALAAPVAAQEAPAPAADAPAADAPSAAAPATPAAPAADGAAPAAEAAPADGATTPPAQGEVMEIVRDTFGDWQVRCSPDGNECFIYQLGLDAEKNPVAEVSILKLPLDAEADAGVTIVTPLGTLLPSGVAVQIDNGQPRQYPFAWCSQVGCFARFGLDRPSIDAMKRGKTGKVVLHAVAAPEQPVTLVLSLTGFTAAFDSLTAPTMPTAGQPAAPAPAPVATPAPVDPAPLAPKN